MSHSDTSKQILYIMMKQVPVPGKTDTVSFLGLQSLGLSEPVQRSISPCLVLGCTTLRLDSAHLLSEHGVSIPLFLRMRPNPRKNANHLSFLQCYCPSTNWDQKPLKQNGSTRHAAFPTPSLNLCSTSKHNHCPPPQGLSGSAHFRQRLSVLRFALLAPSD